MQAGPYLDRASRGWVGRTGLVPGGRGCAERVLAGTGWTRMRRTGPGC